MNGMNANQVRETDFFFNIDKKEKKYIHRNLLKNIYKNHNIIFSDKHSKDIDDIVMVRGKNFYLEYKTDYMAQRTGNLVFELIPYVLSKDFPSNIQGIRFTPLNKYFSTLLELVESVKLNKISSSKISRHFLSESPNHIFSYAISNKDYKDTSSEKDICKHLLFRNNVLGEWVQNNYKKSNLIITKTINHKNNISWHTVSILVPITTMMPINLLKN